MAETTASPKKKATSKATAKPKASPAKKPAATKTKAKTAVKKTKTTSSNLQQRYKLVEVAAYYIAESDGFAGNPVDYWIAAEIQINNTK